MNWKTVLTLIRVDMKSGRLIRGQRLIRYNVKKSTFYTYLLYAIAIAVGIGAGFLVGYIYNVLSTEETIKVLFPQYFESILISLPTIVLVYTLVFTMLRQIQRMGAKFTRQVPYWLPVTWQEHTLASIMAELLGFPLITTAFIASTIVVSSLYIGQTALAIGAIFAMIASAFIASATTEIVRVLQLRFTGTVYKSTGRAAIYVRLTTSLIFFVLFYIIYFSLVSGTNSLVFIQTIASGQSSVWYLPFVWLGLTLYSLSSALWLNGALYLIGSLLLILSIYLLAANLNKRFGLYEPPAITISRGAYIPKTGILGRFGFSSIQAALIRKDLKGLTRRRELMFVFILPIIFIIVPIMTSFNGGQTSSTPTELPLFWFAYMTIFPSVIMAMSLGSFMTGEEGQSIWRIYMSPVSPKDYVKSKYAFTIFFALIILPITATIGTLIYQPSIRANAVLILESILMAFPIGLLSLANGIKGADFNEIPRPRMIRTEYSLINMLTCGAVVFAMLLPFIPYILSIFIGGSIGGFIDLYVATAISGIIAAVLSVIFYKIAEGNAKDLLSKAEL